MKRLVLVACKAETTSNRVPLRRGDSIIRVTALGESETLLVELTTPTGPKSLAIDSNGDFELEPSATAVVVQKLGNGMPTTVELL